MGFVEKRPLLLRGRYCNALLLTVCWVSRLAAQDVPGYVTHIGYDLQTNFENTMVPQLLATNQVNASLVCGVSNGLRLNVSACAIVCTSFLAQGCGAFTHDNANTSASNPPGCCFLANLTKGFTLYSSTKYDTYLSLSAEPSPSPAPRPTGSPPIASPALAKHHSSPLGIILGSTLGAAAAVLLLCCLLLICCRRRRRQKEAAASQGAPKWRSKAKDHVLGMKEYSFAELTQATNQWSEANVVGEGGYGKVYKGKFDTMYGPQVVAVKRGSRSSHQGEEEFLQEILAMSKIRHKHLIHLLGFCDTGSEQCLVYECMVNGSVRDHLLGGSAASEILSWADRVQIALGAAKGLEYLHTAVDPPIIHRDVKVTNILLDAQLNAKVADFGVSKIETAREGNTTIKGTLGYLDPHYLQYNELTLASDVYSFGIVLLELVAGRPALAPEGDGKQWSLLAWAVPYVRTERTVEIVDPRLNGVFDLASVQSMAALAILCIQKSPLLRPTMAEVRKSLEAAERGDHYQLRSWGALAPSGSMAEPSRTGTPSDSTNFAKTSEDSSGGPYVELFVPPEEMSSPDVHAGGLWTYAQSSTDYSMSTDSSAAWRGPITSLNPR